MLSEEKEVMALRPLVRQIFRLLRLLAFDQPGGDRGVGDVPLLRLSLLLIETANDYGQPQKSQEIISSTPRTVTRLSELSVSSGFLHNCFATRDSRLQSF